MEKGRRHKKEPAGGKAARDRCGRAKREGAAKLGGGSKAPPTRIAAPAPFGCRSGVRGGSPEREGALATDRLSSDIEAGFGAGAQRGRER